MGPFLLFVTLIMGFRSEQLLLFSDSMSMERYFPVDTLPELKTELVRSCSVNWTAWSYPCSISYSYNGSSSDWSYISSTWNCLEDSFLFGEMSLKQVEPEFREAGPTHWRRAGNVAIHTACGASQCLDGSARLRTFMISSDFRRDSRRDSGLRNPQGHADPLVTSTRFRHNRKSQRKFQSDSRQATISKLRIPNKKSQTGKFQMRNPKRSLVP